MSLQPEVIGPVPEVTARVARAAFPKGNVYMRMRDVLGTIYSDASFAPLFAKWGQPAEAPWRLALVTVMQFAEGLSDRQAAEAVRARIDWKYALGLELDDPGFDFSVLSEFRGRLVQGSSEEQLLDALLVACKERGYLKARGRQRTDSTHVLGALRVLNRLERVGETMRSALNAIAMVAPDWLRGVAEGGWFERYSRRVEEYRLPKGEQARREYAVQAGKDGMKLLETLWEPTAPPDLRNLEAVEILRRVWISQYVVIDGELRLRDAKEMAPPSDHLESPYETEARYGAKGEMNWIGYKAHLTETCDDDLPHLLTQVHTTIATEADIEQLDAIQKGLAEVSLLPVEHLMVNVVFSPADCTPCQVRTLCTRAKDLPRALTLQPRAEHEAIQKARERQHTEEFTTRHGKRAGIEGTISQGVRAFGLRKARYRGLDKTHLQHVATATAINFGRLADWLAGVPSAGTRVSHFAALLLN